MLPNSLGTRLYDTWQEAGILFPRAIAMERWFLLMCFILLHICMKPACLGRIHASNLTINTLLQMFQISVINQVLARHLESNCLLKTAFLAYVINRSGFHPRQDLWLCQDILICFDAWFQPPIDRDTVCQGSEWSANSVALFPGSAQLSLTCSMEERFRLCAGRAVERCY